LNGTGEFNSGNNGTTMVGSEDVELDAKSSAENGTLAKQSVRRGTRKMAETDPAKEMNSSNGHGSSSNSNNGNGNMAVAANTQHQSLRPCL
jgi:hypothetical protein